MVQDILNGYPGLDFVERYPLRHYISFLVLFHAAHDRLLETGYFVRIQVLWYCRAVQNGSTGLLGEGFFVN